MKIIEEIKSLIGDDTPSIFVAEALLSYPISNWTFQAFTYTRQYGLALDFFQLCQSLFHMYGYLLPPIRAAKVQESIHTGILISYDHMDQWLNFIRYYEINDNEVDTIFKNRYLLLKRKQERLEKNLPLGNMMHKTRAELSNEEIVRRNDYLLRIFGIYVKQYKKYQETYRKEDVVNQFLEHYRVNPASPDKYVSITKK